MIAVVGSRDMSDYGKACTKEVVDELNVKYGIVSGLAKGIDGCAHSYALLQQRSTIAIIGCGLDVCYPKENEKLYASIKKFGLILSEYPYGTKPFAHHFPWRNRIIACLSKCVIVIEAKQRSGTMITVNEALNLGKDIYCFPYRYFDSYGTGCNWLISQGCNIIYCKKDIREI